KISAHRCHLSAMPFQETLSSGLRASLAMNSHSAACFKNSSGGCIGSLLSLTSPIPVVRIKTNSAPEQPTLRNGSFVGTGRATNCWNDLLPRGHHPVNVRFISLMSAMMLAHEAER